MARARAGKKMQDTFAARDIGTAPDMVAGRDIGQAVDLVEVRHTAPAFDMAAAKDTGPVPDFASVPALDKLSASEEGLGGQLPKVCQAA